MSLSSRTLLNLFVSVNVTYQENEGSSTMSLNNSSTYMMELPLAEEAIDKSMLQSVAKRVSCLFKITCAIILW